MEGPLKELAKLEKLTTAKGKAPSINDSLDGLIYSLHDAKRKLEDSGFVDPEALKELSRAIESKKKDVDDRQKEVYSSVSRLGKALDKKFTAPLPSYSRLFESSQSRAALERTIALHFLRTGQFDTAETFLNESGIDISPELHLQFVELHQILKSLRHQDIGPALEWTYKSRAFLQSRSSPLEFHLHRSQYIRLLFSSHPPNPLPALAYANTNLRLFYDDHPVEVKRLMGCVAYLPLSKLQTSPYADLASPSLHFELEPLFAKEYCASLGMSRQIPLRVVGDIGGGGALARIEKGRKVMRERKSEWSQTDELPIEIPLLPENRYHSIFACPVSKEQATEQNPPMMMLCGHVIAKDSLHKLSKAGGNLNRLIISPTSYLGTTQTMEATSVRPSEVLIKKAYSQLLNSGASLAKLRDSALADRLLLPRSTTGVAGRSIAWKLFLTSEEPLNPSSSPVRSLSLLHSLRSSRQNYVTRLREHMRAPDGSYEEGFVLPDSSSPLSGRPSTREAATNLETNNPLSLHKGNPWKAWFAAVELRKTILQDVERTDADVREACSRTWVAGDAWVLFDSVMRGLSRWYEWREPPPNTTSRNVISPLASHVDFNIPNGQLEIKQYSAPIVEACNRIQSTYLQTTDPSLYKHMQAAADYSGQLTVLLRYPSPGAGPAFEDAPHHTSLLLRQALALQMSPTPSTGASVVMENRNMLNIPLEVPVPVPSPPQRRSQNRTASPSHGRLTPPAQGHSRQATTPQMGLPEMIARGLIEKGESFGINKTLMSAVSELRRNIPDLAASLVRSPNTSDSTFPLTDERSPEGRPPWEPRTRFEMENDISTLRSTNKRLGDSLGWIVDVLLQDEAEAAEPQNVKKQKQEALESLSYVRDVLLGNVSEIEEGRLVGEEESRRRRRSKEVRNSYGSIEVIVPPPPPVSVVDSRPETKPSRNVIPPRAMMSPTTSGSGRMPGMPSSGLNRPPWKSYSELPASSTVGTQALPRVPPRAEHKSVNQTQMEDPLGVGIA
ncbi:hypothetical protein C0991_008218 [Blastosporella zonata]|nr:hypothetical protein C0991_008218 [Blastosporella zonata]